MTPEEAKSTLEKVMALKERWIDRSQGFYPFYSLGANLYIDSSSDDDSIYRKKAQEQNPILMANFSGLYDKLIALFQEVYDVPVTFVDGFALPGFHIFLASKVFYEKGGSNHFDMQYQKIKWPYADIDYDNPISFTCPVALPMAGAGLQYWDITQDMVEKMSGTEFAKARAVEPHYLGYSLGKLVLHQGLLLHQIAPTKEINPGDARITLQGHGLLCDGALRLYW
ncbi:MAG: hypothetical protein LLG04_08155 [Parachlamydia sp.]|nr:hypothetical protein [Parachlamydia sp.]